MKSLLLVTIVALWACSSTAKIQDPFSFVNHPELIKGLQPVLAEAIVDLFMKRWTAKGSQEGRDPVIGPGLPDPLIVSDVEFELEDLLNIPEITGNGSISEGVIAGLSSIVDDLAIIALPLPPKIKYIFDANVVDFTGKYTLNVALNETEYDLLHTIIGDGVLQGNVTKPSLVLAMTVVINFITGKVTVSNVAIDLGFEHAIIYAEGLQLNGVDLPLESIDIKIIFDTLLWPLLKVPLQDSVTELVNFILKDCTWLDLLAGNYECTGLFPTEAPVTGVTPTTTTTTVAPAPTTTTVNPATGNPSPTTTMGTTTEGGAMSSRHVGIELFLIFSALLAIFYQF